MDPFPDNINDIQTIKQLIESGTDPNKQYTHNHKTLLHHATMNDNFDIVKYLVEHGANVNAIDWCNATPLQLAASNSNIHIVKYLVESGANVNYSDEFGYTPLLYAAYDNNVVSDDGSLPHNRGSCDVDGTQTMCYLLDHGADINHKNNYGDDAIEIARVNKNSYVADYIMSYEPIPTKGVHD